MMKLRSGPIANVVGNGAAVLAIALVLLFMNRDGKPEPVAAMQTPSVEPEPVVVVSHPSADTSATPMALEWEQLTYAVFKTEDQQMNVLCQRGESRIYVQNNRLQYATPGESIRTLFEWSYPGEWDAQAWLIGPYLLIGSQLENYPHGKWSIIRMEPSPIFVEDQYLDFRPEEVLTVTTEEHSGIILLKIGHTEEFYEYLLDPGKSAARWMKVSDIDIGPDRQERELPSRTDGLRSFDEVHQCCLLDGEPVYMFKDEAGSIVYTREQSPDRYLDIEIVDAKLIPHMDRSLNYAPRLLARFRDKAGVETISFLRYVDRKLPLWLWEAGWELIGSPYEDTFIRITHDKLEVVQFNDWSYEADQTPQLRTLPLKEGQQVIAQGELLQFKGNGIVQTASLRDLVNAESMETLPASPLRNYFIQEQLGPGQTTLYESSRKQVLEGTLYGGDIEYSEIPNELYDALYEKFGSDNDHSVTFHHAGCQWFALVNTELMEYINGTWMTIGELPVSLSIYAEDDDRSNGARDFMRIDGGWIVADTQASRVIKLNNKLVMETELAVPTPYRLTREEDRLLIDSTAQQWITDMELNHVDTVSQPFMSTVGRKIADESNISVERYKDMDTGLIWYVDYSFLYQVNEKEQQYRSMYIGAMGNGKGQTRIVPYGDEVLVLLDRKLERFDRQGNWIGTLEFPRSQPDGIYDTTPQGEGSLIVDEESGVLFMVQGYRVLRIDVKHNKVETVFRQNFADFGKLVQIDNMLYFILRSDQEDLYQRYWTLDEEPAYTEIVEIDMKTLDVSRSFVDGFYDELTADNFGLVLRRYIGTSVR